VTSEYYAMVPKDRRENLEFRKWALHLGTEDLEQRRELWMMCSRDILFYINTFGWLLEPRAVGDAPKVIPFLTYEYQDDAILRMQAAVGVRDVGIHKSRATGATWMCLYLADWYWRFKEWSQIGLVSRTESAVDNPDDPDSLMSKLDFIRDHVPIWLNPTAWERKVSNHSLINVDNNSSVVGYSAVGDVARGGRKLFFILDEFHSFKAGEDYAAHDSTQHVTPCRIVISTPSRKRGPAGAYYDLISDDESNMDKITLDWKDDPQKSGGLYTSEDGRIQILDEGYEFPEGYEFLADGKTRSPYYDWECKRPLATPQSIAAELDRSFGGAAYSYFDGVLIDQLKQTTSRDPYLRGVLGYDAETYNAAWAEKENGPFRLWINPDAYGQIPDGNLYSIGIDIAAGTGGSWSSNSAMVIFDMTTGEQVGEWVSNTMRPDQLAGLAVATGKWFNDAYLVPEVNGPLGATFMKELLRIGYTNIFYRNVELVGFRKKTQKPGYHNSDKGEAILGEMQRAMSTGECVIRSSIILEECGQYVYRNGSLIHAGSANTADESAKGRSHGDVAIAAACGWHGSQDRPVRNEEEERSEAPEGSMAFRRRRSRDSLVNLDGW
jgi:hypothetical protein